MSSTRSFQLDAKRCQSSFHAAGRPGAATRASLRAAGANRFAIGARVTLAAAGRRQLREVRSGGSYLSQSDLRPLFGLGDYAGAVDLEVLLSGARYRFTFIQGPQDNRGISYDPIMFHSVSLILGINLGPL